MATRTDKYVLVGHTPVPCHDDKVWLDWWNITDRVIAKTYVGDAQISTVFLPLDHGWNGELAVFETMIFGGKHNQYCERCGTWDEAVEQHHQALLLLTSEVK